MMGVGREARVWLGSCQKEIAKRGLGLDKQFRAEIRFAYSVQSNVTN